MEEQNNQPIDNIVVTQPKRRKKPKENEELENENSVLDDIVTETTIKDITQSRVNEMVDCALNMFRIGRTIKDVALAISDKYEIHHNVIHEWLNNSRSPIDLITLIKSYKG